MAFVWPVRPRYYEVDQQGVVFNMWYLGWFDEAMTAFLTDLGYDIPTMLAQGFDVQLVHSELDWSAGVGLGDDLGIDVSTTRLGTTSFTLLFRVFRGEELVCTGSTVYVVIKPDGSGKRELPAPFRAALASAGED